MMANPPSYGRIQWEKEREKQLQYLKNACEFPVLDHHTKVGAPKKSPYEVTFLG